MSEEAGADKGSPVERPVARIALVPAAGDLDLLDYRVTEEQAEVALPGARVLVPLGSRRAVGVVVARLDTSPHPRLRPLQAVLDRQRLIDPALLELCRWMGSYYLGGFSEALTAALPGSVKVQLTRMVEVTEKSDETTALPPEDARLVAWVRAHAPVTLSRVESEFGAAGRTRLRRLAREGWIHVSEDLRGAGGLTRHERWYRACRDLDAEEAARWQRQRPAQYEVWAYLRRHPLGRARPAELEGSFPNAAGRLRSLVAAGMVEVLREEVYRPVLDEPPAEDRPVQLSAAQAEAVAAITARGNDSFAPFLLWGVTGSGKTEVYLHAIAATLEAGRNAVVLVPEISLTHQLVDRVRARFGDRVALVHSHLSDGERWDEWRRIARGEASIVVGARSAIFAPLPDLGLLIVDEEHDPAYKQEEGLRYHGRDVAVMRAKLASCPVVLGSATPSMESWYNATGGRYRLLRLDERVEARPLPFVEVINLRSRPAAGQGVPISNALRMALEANLLAGAQSLVFLNRRGFANFLQCHQCGEPLRCPNCSVTMTLHRRTSALRCHHCDHTVPIPGACPQCGGLSLGAWGAGTEQVEAALRQLLPRARIGRMDRDTTARKGALRELLTAWSQQKYDILVGTQMVTKGHDVHGVTLVGVLLADLSLNLPDFRAGERTFQLLTQVAGRAGRGHLPGRVLVQTLQPDHPILRCASHHDFAGFAALELTSRRETNYPPFTRLVLVRCEGESPTATETLAREFAALARRLGGSEVGVLGPAVAPIERVRRRFRWQILLRSADAGALRRVAREARDRLRPAFRKEEVRLLVDVDPHSLL